MIIDDQSYNLIIIGTGAGGGTLAAKLAPTGKKILILERGDRMPLSEQNRSDVDVFKRDRYRATEQWYDSAGEPFSPQLNYAVGGNTKIYNAALLRMRERDFEAVPHHKGVSPAWCVKYAEFEPYYTAAETLYQVHGQTSSDPTEPVHSSEYPFSPIAHQEQIQAVVTAISSQGLHPTALPLGLTRQEEDPTSDSDVSALTPALTHPNVTLKTGAKVVCLHTNPSGKAEAPPMLSVLAKFMPGFGLKQLATHLIGWWVQTADLPNLHNRVRLQGNKLFIDYTANNTEAHDRLIYRWIDILKGVEKSLDGFQRGVMHPKGEVPLPVMAHQCGTCGFGDDPQTSVLDRNCRTHDLDNLYVVDGSFFPSNASVSPALTIMANALRVGDILIDRLQ